MTEDDPELSPAGRERRDAILALTLRRVRLRRRVRRSAGLVALATLAVAVLALLLPDQTAPASGGVARIPTISGAVARIAPLPQSATSAERWEVLDDHALLAALRDAGRPATLSRSDGRARVVFADGRE